MAIKSEFKPMMDGLAEGMPLSFVSVTFARIIPEMIRTHPKMAATFLWGLWECVSEVITSDDVKLSRGQRVAAVLLTEYFSQEGDWDKMVNHIIKQASDSIPEPIIRAATDRLYESIRGAFYDWAEKLKQEGKWTGN